LKNKSAMPVDIVLRQFYCFPQNRFTQVWL